MSDWKEALNGTLEKWDKRYIITSPDVDGLLSTAILLEKFDAQVIGFYNATQLLLFDEFSVDDANIALWLDHDISHPPILCIGQHLTLHSRDDKLPRRNIFCFNPNVHFRQSYPDSFKGEKGSKRDKYPFGTCHLFLHFIDDHKLSDIETVMMSHADSTYANICLYEANCKIWKDLMFDNNEQFNEIWKYPISVKQQSSEVSKLVDIHQSLINDLKSAGINTRSSQSMKRDLPQAIENFTGHQSITYRKNNERYMKKMNMFAKVISKNTRFQLPKFGEINHTIKGEFDKMYPDNVLYGDFDKLMVTKRIFSHAIVRKSQLNITIMKIEDFPD